MKPWVYFHWQRRGLHPARRMRQAYPENHADSSSGAPRQTKKVYKVRVSKRFIFRALGLAFLSQAFYPQDAGKSEFIPFHDNRMRDFDIFESTGGLCRPSSRLVRRRISALPAWFGEY